VSGEWAWLLQAFAGQYGVRSNYAVMSHLRWVLRPGVASVSQLCFDLLARQLRTLLEQEAVGGSMLTQHEATMLIRIKADTEELLKLAFENYHLLSAAARKGILDGACSPPPGGYPEFPPTALVAGVHLFETMRDVFHPSDVEWLGDRFRVAAKARWARIASACDDGAVGPVRWRCGSLLFFSWLCSCCSCHSLHLLLVPPPPTPSCHGGATATITDSVACAWSVGE
jgi:hypothetical protein